MTWVTAKSDLLSYFITEAGMLRQITVMLRNLTASITQRILMKIRLFASESARVFNEISNSFLIIWYDKIKLFSSNNWQKLIKYKSISNTLSRKKTWSKVFFLSISLLDSAFAFSRIWVWWFCHQLIVSDSFYSCDLTSCIWSISFLETIVSVYYQKK